MKRHLVFCLIVAMVITSIPDVSWAADEPERPSRLIDMVRFGDWLAEGSDAYRELVAEPQEVTRRDPRGIYKFPEVEVRREKGKPIMLPILPEDRYFFRDFVLKGQEERLARGDVHDRTGMPFDYVVNNAPQSSKGFLIGWLQEGQCVGITKQTIRLTFWAADGNLYEADVPPNWPVVYDCRDASLPLDAPREILAPTHCANKVVRGAGIVEPIPVTELEAAEKEAEDQERKRREHVRIGQDIRKVTTGEEKKGGISPWWFALGALPLLFLLGDDKEDFQQNQNVTRPK